MKKLLVIKVPTIENKGYPAMLGLTLPLRSVHEANMVIIKSPTHFRCIKNRWEETTNDEKIPNYLLKDFLLKYKDQFTPKELIESFL